MFAMFDRISLCFLVFCLFFPAVYCRANGGDSDLAEAVGQDLKDYNDFISKNTDANSQHTEKEENSHGSPIPSVPPRITDVPKIATFVSPPNSWYVNFIFDPKSETIYARVSDGHVHRLNILSGEIVDLGKLVDADGWGSLMMDIHPSQDWLLISGGKDGKSNTIDLLDAKNISVKKTFEFPGHKVNFRDVFFANDGKQLLVFAYTENQTTKEVKRVFIIVDIETGAMTEKEVPFDARPEPGFALDVRREQIALITATVDENYFIFYCLKNNFKPLQKISFPPHTVSNIIFTNDNLSFVYYNDYGIINNKIEFAVGMRQVDQKEDDFTIVSQTPNRDIAVSQDGRYMFLAFDTNRRGMFINLRVARAVGALRLMYPVFSVDSKFFAAIDNNDSDRENPENTIVVYSIDSLDRLCEEKGRVFDFLIPYAQKISKCENCPNE